MSNKNSGLWSFLAGAFIVGGYFYVKNKNTQQLLANAKSQINKKDVQLIEKDQHYIELLKKYIEDNKNAPDNIKDQLINLKSNCNFNDPDVNIELDRVVDRLANGEKADAISKLGNIVENVLKDKLVELGEYEDRSKTPTLVRLLSKAVKCKLIDDKLASFGMLLKDKRDDGYHNLNFQHDKNIEVISFIMGIEIIGKISI